MNNHLTKAAFFTALLFLFVGGGLRADAAVSPIIPAPEKFESEPGEFKLTSRTTIIVDKSAEPEGLLLAERLRKSTGFKIPLRVEAQPSLAKNAITLAISTTNQALGEEGYEMQVTTRGVLIQAPHHRRRFLRHSIAAAIIAAANIGFQRGVGICVDRSLRTGDGFTEVQVARHDAGREPAFFHQAGSGTVARRDGAAQNEHLSLASRG